MRYGLLFILFVLISPIAKAGGRDSTLPPVTLAGSVPHYFSQAEAFPHNSYSAGPNERLYRTQTRRGQVGTFLTIAGSVAFLVGAGFFAYATTPDARNNKYDMSPLGGFVFCAGGVALMIPGIHLLSTKNRPHRERIYHRRPERRRMEDE